MPEINQSCIGNMDLERADCVPLGCDNRTCREHPSGTGSNTHPGSDQEAPTTEVDGFGRFDREHGGSPGWVRGLRNGMRGIAGKGPATPCSGRLSQRPERGAELGGEELGLLPGCEVTTLGNLVVVDELWICPLGPAPRGLVLFAREYADGNWNGHALGVEKAALVFPIESRRRHPSICKPVKRDVIEDLIARQFAGGAGHPVEGRSDRRRRLTIRVIMVEEPGSQTNR